MKKLLICLLIFVVAIFISCNFVINATTTKTVLEQPMIQTEPLSLIVETPAPSTDILPEEEPAPTPEQEPLATREEIELLALCTMAEAEGECEQGQRLVIDSVLNRVDNPHFPDTISEVIWQKNQYAGMYGDRITRCYVMDELVKLVEEELENRTDYDVVFFNAGHYPEMWMKANPNIGKTVSYETYQLDVERAEKAPAARNDILAKRFGLPMEGYTYYFTYEETLPHRKRDYWQMACALGGDLSQGDDFCSFTFLFPLRNGSFGVKTRNYITSRTLNKLPAAMRNKYEQFMDEGSLVVLDGTVLDPMQVYEDLDEYIVACGYDVRCFGYDPYNAKEFVERWAAENGPFGIEKVIQGAKTESVPLGELKKLAEDRMLLFDEELMTYAMGNCIAMEDTNGNRKLMKKRYEQKIDAVSAMMDSYIAYKRNPEAFE